MIVSCHQPNHIPHLGFLDKMKKADVFVILDTVQFVNNNFHHRNRIRTDAGWMWLTVPVERHRIPLKDIHIKEDATQSRQPWREYHWNAITAAYNKTNYFEKFGPALERIYKDTHHMLVALNMAIIKYLTETADITKPLILASDLGIDADDASRRLALITERLGGDTYLSGPSGRTKYELRREEFDSRGIKIAFQEFNHPSYPQYHMRRGGTFEKNLSAIDALFNIGTIPI